MESIKNFISECGEAPPATDQNDETESPRPELLGGTLMITACHDFDNATSKTAAGLDEPHAIRLPHSIRQCFSSSSSHHAFILSVDGHLYSVGKNDHGQLGTGDIVSYQYPVEVPLSALFSTGTIITKIATGRSHTLLLLDNGDVYGCGSNAVGQLGLGDSKAALRDALRFVKIPSLTGIRDISCGHEHSLACDRSGRLFTFGHPQYGQLGHGTDGSFIKDGGKGAAMQFRSVFLPRQVEKFVVKDTHGKLVSEAYAADVNVRLVAAGKNHSVCVEEWENNGRNKVYTFGFGGYGRLGHNSGTDELYPREIINPFQCIVAGQQVPPVNHPQKQIVQILAGSTYTLAISKSRHLYFWGKLSNSQRGEATMYPKMEMNLYGWKSRLCSGGSNSIFVAADDSIMGWGIPVAGKFGFEGGAKSSVGAKFIDVFADLTTIDITCGYGFVLYVIQASTSETIAKLAAFPDLPAPSAAETSSSAKAKDTKKRAGAEVKEAPKKKGKGK